METFDSNHRAYLESVLIPLVTASDTELPILGKENLTSKIGNREYEHEVFIVEIADITGILGIDFLMKYEGKIHFKKQ